MFQTKVIDKIKTQILCSVIFFSLENRAVYEIMWKNIAESDRPHDNITRRVRFACCTTNAKGTQSEYEILIAFLLQQWLSENASILLHN